MNRKTAIFAYIEEPPFAWTQPSGIPTGCDVEHALTVLKMIGFEQIEISKVTFSDLIPGVDDHKWTLNTPMFITSERSKRVKFSRPVWILSDGFMVRRDHDQGINSYTVLAQNNNLRLGVVRDQVQHQRAMNAGINPEQITIFEKQEDAVSALHTGQIDAYVATTMGHRTYITQTDDNHQLAVMDSEEADNNASFGAYSFSKSDIDLVDTFNQALATYVKSPQYRTTMISYGFTDSDINHVISQYKS